MMKFFLSLVALAIVGATAVQLYHLQVKRAEQKVEYDKVNKKVTALLKENFDLQADVQYFKDPENLEKEARSQLNYAKPGEKLIIVVPKKSH